MRKTELAALHFQKLVAGGHATAAAAPRPVAQRGVEAPR
jgi:hypothetical protein